MESFIDVNLSKEEKPKRKKTKKSKPPKKPVNKTALIVIVSVVVLLGIGVFVVISPRAKYVSGIRNKVLSAFMIPNNPHAQESYDNYLKAKEIGLSDKSETYLYEAFYSNPSKLQLVNNIAKAFGVDTEDDDVMADHFQKALILSKKALRVDPNNLEASKRLGAAYFATGQKELASEIVQRVLFQSPNDPDAIDLMCRIAVDAEQWDTLEKWGERGYKIVPKDNPRSAGIMYMYSKALYENSKKQQAREVFAEAEQLDINSWARNEFIEAGGLPCEITSLLVSNKKYDGTIIDKPGDYIRSYDTNFLAPNLTIIPLRSGSFTFDIKFFKDGELRRKKDDYSDYSYSSTAELDSTKQTQTIVLGSWGSEKNGHWSNGSYRFEIWWRGNKLFVKSFDIHY